MTKSREKGDNPFVLQAKKENSRTGRAIGEILEELLAAAKRDRDTRRRLDIERAQKYLKFRNGRKRRGKQR